MATKDWKKISKDIWKNTNRESRLIRKIWITRTKVPTSLFGTKEHLEYEVAIGYIIDGEKGKVIDYSYYYKIKSDALRKVRDYIKKHK